MTNKRDHVQKFLFEHANVRGQLVYLNESYRTVMAQHAYPMPIQQRLGKMLLASTLLTSALKFQGRLTLQMQSDGPIRLLVAKCTHELHIRALAQWDDDATIPELQAALGAGQLVITVDPDQTVRPYQSIVALEGATLTAALEHYFSQSEQIPTRLWLAPGEHQAAGLLLQQLPGERTPEQEDFWQHVTTLASTVSHQELLTLSHETLLQRLFATEDIRLFAEQPVAFRCNCSHEFMCNAVLSMGPEEALSVFDEMKHLVITCEYCNNERSFDRHDVEQIFDEAEGGSTDESGPTLH